MTILYNFGHEAKRMRDKARIFATCTGIARTYARDTINGASTADYDLKQAAQDLRAAADDLDALGDEVETIRAELSQTHLHAAE